MTNDVSKSVTSSHFLGKPKFQVFLNVKLLKIQNMSQFMKNFWHTTYFLFPVETVQLYISTNEIIFSHDTLNIVHSLVSPEMQYTQEVLLFN